MKKQDFVVNEWPVAMMSYILPQHIGNLSKQLRSDGLTTPMWRVLSALVTGNADDVGSIAAYTALERSYVGRVLDKMEAERLVRKRPDKTDKRYVRIELTKGGLEKFKATEKIVEKLHRDSVAGLSAADFKKLCELLAIVLQNVSHSKSA